jgi:hypothetical protein
MFMVFIFLFLYQHGQHGGTHHYWIIFRHEVGWSLRRSLVTLAHYWTFIETIVRAFSYVFLSLMDDTHIVGPLSLLSLPLTTFQSN